MGNPQPSPNPRRRQGCSSQTRWRWVRALCWTLRSPRHGSVVGQSSWKCSCLRYSRSHSERSAAGRNLAEGNQSQRRALQVVLFWRCGLNVNLWRAWMDQRDSYCLYLRSSEPTAKGTGLGLTAGKEDPVELYSSLTWWNNAWDVG